MNPTRSVAVAGCGPAGLACALLLSRAGARVTLFERFETPRPVGSGLMIQPTGLAVLARLGLAEALIARSSRIDRLYGETANTRRVTLDVRYRDLDPALYGLGVHRSVLFDLLHEAARSDGLEIVGGRTVTAAPADPDGRRRLRFADGEETAPFDLIVDALGARSPLARTAGRTLDYGALWATLQRPAGDAFDPAALEQRYLAASVMAGVLPIGRHAEPGRPEHETVAFFWSLRLDRLDAWREAGLAAWKWEVLSVWPAVAPLLDQISDPEQLVVARYAHRRERTPVEPGLARVGDSWHSASPQLGQGANMALLDAFALARALETEPDLSTALERYRRSRSGHVRLYQAVSALFTPAYQSDSRVLPWLRDWLVGPLIRVPPAPALQAALVAGAIGAPLRSLGLPPALGRSAAPTPIAAPAEPPARRAASRR